MFVGIISACIPSAAFAARQKHPLYQRTILTVTSPKSTWIASRRDFESPVNIMDSNIHPPSDVLKSTDRKYARYFGLSEHKLDWPSKLDGEDEFLGENQFVWKCGNCVECAIVPTQ
jgi:hypothetical protein